MNDIFLSRKKYEVYSPPEKAGGILTLPRYFRSFYPA